MCREHLKLNSKKLYNPNGKWTKDLQRYMAKKDVQMTPKHMKRWSTLSIIRERHIKSRRHCLGCSKSRTLAAPNPGKDVEQEECEFTASRDAKWHSHFGRQCGSFLQNKPFSYHTTQSLRSLLLSQVN